MSQKPKERRLDNASAMAKVVSVRTGMRKLNVVAASIRGMKVQRALNELEFSPKRIAKDVRKALVMKRFHARARGRGARIVKPFSNLTLIVREREETA